MIKYIKNNKLLFIMTILSVISFLFGILFNTFLSNSNKKIISENINLLINNKLIIPKNLILTNTLTTLSIWILGISIIGIIIILPIYLFKTFILSFELISLITNLKLKNILIIILYLIPNIINTTIYFIICYYAITYSLYLIRHIFFNKKYNLHLITKKYLLVLLISLVLITISTIIEIIILPHLNMIKI